MASDEIEIAFKKYKDGIEGMDYIEIAMSKDDFTAGYTQGRADAWKWIPVSERLPKERQLCLVMQKGEKFPNVWTWMGENWAINVSHRIFGSHKDITHWLPIKLPGGEND